MEIYMICSNCNKELMYEKCWHTSNNLFCWNCYIASLDVTVLTLKELVQLIRDDWDRADIEAGNYLEVLNNINYLSDSYKNNTGFAAVNYFLMCSEDLWKTKLSINIKEELKRRCISLL